MASGDSSGRRPIVVVEAPAHPVQQLQGPFEESMFESQSTQQDEVDVPLDATSRRTLLLEAPTYQRVVAGRWKQKKGEKYHPLWKLVAQMSFGIHLLAENMAKSEEDVFQILQTHVDDIDIFLERTTEDFVLAQEDIQERLKCLQLPLQHPEVFDRMLEDRTFRNSIVDGNEKIEHIVTRTGCAMKDALKDVQKGFDSTSALERYLHDLQNGWVRTTPEHEAVFIAMLGNVEGWKRAFQDLHTQGNKLAGLLKKLTDVINQMQQRAGEVSRRLIRQQQRQGGSISGSNITYISHQPSNSRSSSRQQATPSPLAAKKPLPAPTSRGSTRQHSRNQSSETAQVQRVGTSQSQRTGTAQSMRSNGRSETPLSRAQSRDDMLSIPTKHNNNTTTTSDDTLHGLYMTANSGQRSIEPYGISTQQFSGNTHTNREELDFLGNSRSERRRPDMHQPQIRRQESNISAISEEQPTKLISRNFVPVELPAEIPSTAFLQAPISSTNRLSLGLGILPSDRRAQAQLKGFNPTAALIELLNDPSRYSRLPLTPNSARSPGATLAALEGQQNLISQTLQQSALREPTPELSPPNPSDGDVVETSPTTPAWGSRSINPAEQNRVMNEKIPFSSSTSESPSTSTQTSTSRSTNRPTQPKLRTSISGLLSSSGRITPIPEISALQDEPSELSTGNEHEIPMLSRQNSAEAIKLANKSANQAAKKKKLSFIAELEGSEPIYLPSTVYTPISASAEVTMAYELEAPQMHFNLPPRSMTVLQDSASVSELSAKEDEKSDDKAETPESAAKVEDKIDLRPGKISRKPVPTGAFTNAKSRPQGTSHTSIADEYSDEQKTPKPLSDNRNMVHEPSFTPAKPPVHESAGNHFSPGNSTSLKPVLEFTHADEDEKENLTQHTNGEVVDTRTESSSVPGKSGPERSDVTFPPKLNIITTKGENDTKDSPTIKTPNSPNLIDLARSNTKESRQKWKAFFGQRKSPRIDADKAPASPSSLQSVPSKQSPQSSPRSATFSNLSLRPKASSDNLTPSPNLRKADDGRSTRNASPLIKSERNENSGAEDDGGDVDHHSIVDDYV